MHAKRKPQLNLSWSASLSTTHCKSLCHEQFEHRSGTHPPDDHCVRRPFKAYAMRPHQDGTGDEYDFLAPVTLPFSPEHTPNLGSSNSGHGLLTTGLWRVLLSMEQQHEA